mmetsp:Transcript_66701/g.171774  ORF Transcript_66701/g.171774 Transcript_66701/m.171774 type:complete len:257 (-) Transcript_66701:64-834(-)
MSWMAFRIRSRSPSSCSRSCACSCSNLRCFATRALWSCTALAVFSCAATTSASSSVRSCTFWRACALLAASSRASSSMRPRSFAVALIFLSSSCTCSLLAFVICSAAREAVSKALRCSDVKGSCFCAFSEKSSIPFSNRCCSVRRVSVCWLSWDLLRSSLWAWEPRSCCLWRRTSRRLRTCTFSGLTFSSLARAAAMARSTCVVPRWDLARSCSASLICAVCCATVAASAPRSCSISAARRLLSAAFQSIQWNLKR